MGKKIVIAVLLLVIPLLMAVSLSSNFTDESALIAIKSQITSDSNSIIASNWSGGTSFCSWVGVSCSTRRQRVTALNLPNMGLGGTIPKAIGNLSFLHFLNISINNFRGNLPRELGHLRRLKSLDLSSNEISGDLPTSLGFLIKLQVLSLSHNHLMGSIPREIGFLHSLRRLAIINNSISGFIPSTIFNISSLREIFLSNNNLYGTLPMEMCNNRLKLQVLNLQRNQLSGQLPTSLHKCTQLQFLCISFNDFTGSIPMGIGNLTKLKVLALARNNMTGKIPPSVVNMSNLEGIDIGVNNIHGSIPQEFGQLLNLNFLSMSANNLGGAPPHSIFNISTLESLALSINHFFGNLPSTIGLWLPNLKFVYLAGNQFSGPIPCSISNASKLTEIDLRVNFFNGSVPMTLGNLQHLQYLSLSLNNLTNDQSGAEIDFLSSLTNCKLLKLIAIGGNPLNGILPKFWGNLSISLQQFYAASSGIRGMIPSEIGNLSNLVSLELGGNDLTGSIPNTIGQLSKIQRLGISVNLIHGLIPNSFCNLTNIGELILRRNKLSGPIPNCLGLVTSLRILSLGSNALTSKIPPTLWSLEDVITLDLSSNILTGSLPPEIGNLKHISELFLSENQFTGELPSTIGQLQSMESLDLCQNRLQGLIPLSFSNLISLKSLNLSQNNLSGVIPKSLEKLSDLKYLNVSFNRLTGEIPTGGPFANFTPESFSQNDALCGAPQFHVKACKSHRKSGKIQIVLKFIVPSIVALVLVAVALLIWWLQFRNKNKQIMIQVDPPISITHRRISYHEILYATNHFSDGNLIGKGSIGTVYKGTFSDGMITAVKVFDLELQRAFTSFDAECEVIRNIRHRNLVKIISSCSNLDFKALVLEYMPNGNLENWLYSHNYFLNIVERLGIMIDVASALEYLHRGSSPSVVHCDLKPSNILLDEDMVAHIADFGIAKLLAENKSITHTKTLGTIGYMAPEYGSAGIVSIAGDVYSYGILLLETFTRKKPTDDLFVGEVSLKSWVSESFPSAVMDIVDGNLVSGEEENFTAIQNFLSSIFKLALECTSELPEERINMEDALVRLKKFKTIVLENLMRP